MAWPENNTYDNLSVDGGIQPSDHLGDAEVQHHAQHNDLNRAVDRIQKIMGVSNLWSSNNWNGTKGTLLYAYENDDTFIRSDKGDDNLSTTQNVATKMAIGLKSGSFKPLVTFSPDVDSSITIAIEQADSKIAFISTPHSGAQVATLAVNEFVTGSPLDGPVYEGGGGGTGGPFEFTMSVPLTISPGVTGTHAIRADQVGQWQSWTPVMSQPNGGTVAGQSGSGRYVHIGNLVYGWGRIVGFSTVSAQGAPVEFSLPKSVREDTGVFHRVGVAQWYRPQTGSTPATIAQYQAERVSGTSRVRFLREDSYVGISAIGGSINLRPLDFLTGSDLNTVLTSGMTFDYNFCYETASPWIA